MSTFRVVVSLVSLIVILVVVQSVTFRLQQKKSESINTSDKTKIRQEVQSLQAIPSPTSGAAGPTVMPSTPMKSGLSPTPVPSTTRPATMVILNNFIYTNATVIEQDDYYATLQTFDAVQTVFQWYEKKIEELDGRSKATVKTEVNDEFLAKLRATVKNDIVDIEIRKKAEEKVVFIVITISPS